MAIEENDTVRVIRTPGMPRMQALHVGQTGPGIDRYRVGGREQYRVYLGAGKALDFLADEIELLSKGATHVGH